MTPTELRQWLEHHNIDQGQLAEKLGVIRLTVNRWVNEKVPVPTWVPLALETLERRISGK